MPMDEELVRPDPFYVRLEIANELERIATGVHARSETYGGHLKQVLRAVADVLDDRASAIRGALQREADREARAQEAAE